MVRSIAFACALTLSSVLVTSHAAASTYVVDAAGGAGSNFTDIGAAVAAVQAGDVLLVMPGQYAAFVLDKGVIVVGYSNVVVQGPVTIQNVPLGPRAALVHLAPASIAVTGCMGSVVLQELSSVHTFDVAQSNDVRASALDVHPLQGPHAAVTTGTARIELVDCTILGSNGVDPAQLTGSGSGEIGIDCLASSRIHITRGSIAGGDGATTWMLQMPGGNGAWAIHMAYPSEIHAAGPGVFRGGAPGAAAWLPTCNMDGFSGGGVTTDSPYPPQPVVVHSGISFFLPHYDMSFGCDEPWHQQFAIFGAVDMEPAPWDPGLSIAGTPTAGATITFTVDAAPGSHAVLHLGRRLILQPTPGVDIEKLVEFNRTFDLGIVPASGQVTKAIPLPASFTPGTFFAAQAEFMGSNGLRRTNSVPVIVR